MKAFTRALTAICMLGLSLVLFPTHVLAASIVYDYTGTLALQAEETDLLGLNGATFHWVGTFTASNTPSFTNGVNLDRFTGVISLTLSGTVGGLHDGTFTPTQNTIGELSGSGGNDQFQFSNVANFSFGSIRLDLAPCWYRLGSPAPSRRRTR